MTAPDIGPYEDEQAARRAAFAVVPPEPDWAILRSGQNRELIRLALRDAGVEASEFEDRVLRGLGHHEDFAVAVIAGWIRRAHEAAKPGPHCVTFDAGAPDAYHVLSESLGDYANRERDVAGHEKGNDARERWAALADRFRGQVEDAMSEGGN